MGPLRGPGSEGSEGKVLKMDGPSAQWYRPQGSTVSTGYSAPVEVLHRTSTGAPKGT